MIIGIDASRIPTSEPTGTKAYSYYLIKNLAKIDRKNKYILYSPKTSDFLRCLPENFQIKVIPLPRLWTQVRLSLEMIKNRDKIDVLFIPAHTVPIFHHERTVVTVHGLEYEYFPKSYPPRILREMKHMVNKSCKWADKIITVSNTTKHDLEKFYKIPKDKINVVYLGIENQEEEVSEKSSENILKKFKLERSAYLLYIGRLEKRKNLVRAIRAFNEIKCKDKISSEMKFVIAGKPGYGTEEIHKVIRDSKLENEVLLPGYISEMEKQVLYNNARALIFISLYEGFGLPLLEAMEAKLPIITSKNSALGEIINDAGITIDPEQQDDISKGLEKVINDEQAREEIVKKGTERLKDFSWEKCAKNTMEILENVATRKK